MRKKITKVLRSRVLRAVQVGEKQHTRAKGKGILPKGDKNDGEYGSTNENENCPMAPRR